MFTVTTECIKKYYSKNKTKKSLYSEGEGEGEGEREGERERGERERREEGRREGERGRGREGGISKRQKVVSINNKFWD